MLVVLRNQIKELLIKQDSVHFVWNNKEKFINTYFSVRSLIHKYLLSVGGAKLTTLATISLLTVYSYFYIVSYIPFFIKGQVGYDFKLAVSFEYSELTDAKVRCGHT